MKRDYHRPVISLLYEYPRPFEVWWCPACEHFRVDGECEHSENGFYVN